MKKKLWLLLVLIISVLIVTPVYAAGTYRAVIEVTDTLGSSRTGVPVLVPFNSEGAVTPGLMASDGLDTRMFEETTERYYMAADDKVGLLVPSLDASQIRSYNFETGYSPPNTSFGLITGTGGYVTISDDATLELGNNFSIEWKGYVDTTSGSDKNIVYKQNAFRTYVSGDEEITSEISNIPKLIYYDTGDDNGEPVGDNWGANEYDGAQSFTTTGAFIVDRIELYMNQAFAGNDNYTVSIRLMGATPTTNPALTTGTGAVITGTNWIEFDVTNYALSASTQYVIVIYNSAGNDNWREDGSTATYAGGTSWTNDNDAGWVEDTDDDFMFRIYMANLEVVATGVSSGETKVKAIADGTDLKIYIDDVEEDSIALSGASVPDNANDWLVDQNNVMPYMEYYKHTVGGTLITHYEPNDIIVNTSYDGTADAGGDTDTIIDAELTQVDDYWNGALVTITDTTDDLAPKGETSVVLDFAAATDEITLETALTAGVDVGDTYTVEFGTLPDREGTAQDGRITWGVNSDLSVAVGGLKSIASYTSTSTEEGEPPVIVGAPSDITGFYPSETEITDMPWYDLVSRASRGQAVYSTGTVSGTADSTTLTGSGTSWDLGWRGYTVVITGDSTIYYIESINSPTSITLASTLDTSPSGATYSITTPSLGWATNDFYGILGIFVGVAVGVGVAVATGSALLAALAVGIGLTVAAGTSTLGWWVILVYALVAATYLVVSRSM